MININPAFSRYFSNKIQKEKLIKGTKEKLFLLIPNYCLWLGDTNDIKTDIRDYNKNILSVERFWLFYTKLLSTITKNSSITDKYKALKCDFEEIFANPREHGLKSIILISKVNIYD